MDRHTRQNYHLRPQPDIIFNDYGCGFTTLLINAHVLRNIMIVVGDKNTWPDQHMVAYYHGLTDVEFGAAADERILADLETCTLINDLQPNIRFQSGSETKTHGCWLINSDAGAKGTLGCDRNPTQSMILSSHSAHENFETAAHFSGLLPSLP
jgi:hypothetical protein